MIEYDKEAVWRQFLGREDWRVVYFGPAAAVFVLAATPAEKLPAGLPPFDFASLRNAETAVRAFRFASALGDLPTAWRIARQLEGPLRPTAHPQDLEKIRAYRSAHHALRENDSARATALFEEALVWGVPSRRDLLILSLLRTLQHADSGTPPADLEAIHRGLKNLAAPDDH